MKNSPNAGYSRSMSWRYYPTALTTTGSVVPFSSSFLISRDASRDHLARFHLPHYALSQTNSISLPVCFRNTIGRAVPGKIIVPPSVHFWGFDRSLPTIRPHLRAGFAKRSCHPIMTCSISMKWYLTGVKIIVSSRQHALVSSGSSGRPCIAMKPSSSTRSSRRFHPRRRPA